MGVRVFAASALGGGWDTLRLIRDEIEIASVIGLAEPPADAAGAVDGDGQAQRLGVPFLGVSSYKLDVPGDRTSLEDRGIDVLLVLAWQRLIPAWLLRSCRIGALGLHGSAYGIAGGRGRSPQTWAILLREPAFHLSLFVLDPEVDAGPVVATSTFDLTDDDDIRTSYGKSSQAAAQMIRQTASGGWDLSKATPQQGEVRYLPRRIPEDGEIDWTRSSDEISAFVRAQTHPYPGAFGRIDGDVVRVWSVESAAGAGAEPGTILAADDSIIVATGDGGLRLVVHDGPVRIGARFEPCGFAAQMRRIVQRHERAHPGKPLADAILRAAGLA